MTYREKYQQLHPEQDVSRIHVSFCPDLLLEYIPGFRCPFGFIPPNADVCRSCWDSQIPGTEAVPPKSEPEAQPSPTPEKPTDSKPTARILVEVIGDTIHMEADGDMEDLVLRVLATVHGDTKDVYDSAESKLAAEKIIYGFDRALNPLSRIRSFDDKETD